MRSWSVERVAPTETREAGKICVARAQLRAVLDSEGREVRIVHEVARRSERPQELSHDGSMTIAWMYDDGTRLAQPLRDHVECARC
jgi:hypothetical protein